MTNKFWTLLIHAKLDIVAELLGSKTQYTRQRSQRMFVSSIFHFEHRFSYIRARCTRCPNGSHLAVAEVVILLQ